MNRNNTNASRISVFYILFNCSYLASSFISRDLKLIQASFYFKRSSYAKIQSTLSNSEDEYSNMPDRRAFSSFFNAMDVSGMKTLTFDAFLNHDDVKILIEHGSLTLNSIKKTWFVAFNKASSLNEEDAYSVLCKIMCSVNNDKVSYLEQEFHHLCTIYETIKSYKNNRVNTFLTSTISYNTFLKWNEIAELVDDQLVSEDDIEQLYKDICGSTRNEMNLDKFLEINKALSTLFEKNLIRDDAELAYLADQYTPPMLAKSPTSTLSFTTSSLSDSFPSSSPHGDQEQVQRDNIKRKSFSVLPTSAIHLDDNNDYSDPNYVKNGSNDDNDANRAAFDEEEDSEDSSMVFDLRDVDVWDSSFDPTASLEVPFLNYLEAFFNKNAESEPGSGDEPRLSYKRFSNWKDLQEILSEGQLDPSCLKDLWLEALQERKTCQRTGKLDLDTFLRLNVRIDVMLQEMSEIVDNLAEDDFETYHRKEFNKIASGKDLIVFEQLLQWSDLKSMLEEGVVSLDQVRSLWMKLPREIIRPYMATFDLKDGSSDKKVFGGEAINLTSFLAFSASLHDLHPDYCD